LGKFFASRIFIPYFFSRALLVSIIRRGNVFSGYKKNRGMSITHDWLDWLGGPSYEVASVQQIFHFLNARGFTLENISTHNGPGHNQFVFIRDKST